MTERIDFALEPGVVVFAILFFVLINVLLAAVLYPYFRNHPSEETESSAEEIDSESIGDSPASDERPLEERVEEFREEIHRERG